MTVGYSSDTLRACSYRYTCDMSFRCRLQASSICFCLLIGAFVLSFAGAQTPTQTPSSMPAATPVPASSLPSVPVGTSPASSSTSAPAKQNQQPAQNQQQPFTAAAPSYVPPVKSVQVPTRATAASLPSVATLQLSDDTHPQKDTLSSTYIPMDSWVYPAAMRLYSLGYLDTSFITMRPWTRRSLKHMLDETKDDIVDDQDSQAMEILVKLQAYLAQEDTPPNVERGNLYGVDTVYSRVTGIGGVILRDSFHLGQTIANDYGRPYQAGFNNITGFSALNEMGPFSLYVRGEYQHSPGGPGYSQTMAAELSTIDEVPWSGPNLKSATIPAGPIAAQNPFRLVEATFSAHLWGHEISGGKSDDWYGPGAGGGMAWSNNAENIYSFRINRVEPLHIPLFSRIFGDVRYDFFVGSLKGHTLYNSPWIHSEEIELHPAADFQFGFQRSVIWGGEGHEPVTLHTFLRSFFSLEDTENNPASKATSADPGARFSTFNFAWRLPFFTHSLTLYTDSIVHDDVTPISAPRRAAYRPGIYLSQFPHFHKLDLRVEAASTDISTLRSMNGQFNYFEADPETPAAREPSSARTAPSHLARDSFLCRSA